MKKKRKLLVLGTVLFGVVFSAAIHAFDFGNNYVLKQEKKIDNPAVLATSVQKKKQLSKVVTISSGFESLSTNEERLLYQKIKSGCGNISNKKSESGFYPIAPITIEGEHLKVSQIKKVLYAIQNDIPNIFWISNMFSCEFGYGIRNTKNNTIKLNSVFSKSQKDSLATELENKVSQIASKVSSDTSDYEKELFFHDYIVDNCKYKNISGNPEIYTAYGCLIDGAAVCEGYSKAMQLLLNRVGVDCRTIVGSRGSEPHMWNLVKIGGNWYHLDVTWDGGDQWQRYNYFNVTDKIIKSDHIINPASKINVLWGQNDRYNFQSFKCSSMKDNYYQRNALKISNFDYGNDFMNYIAKVAVNKKRYFYIKVDDSLDFEKIKKKVLSSEIFNYFSKVNKYLSNNCKIKTNSISYSVCKPQRVIIVKLNYV